ncbi:MAG: hypothetical protein V7K54_23135 [Nostoc sp.]
MERLRPKRSYAAGFTTAAPLSERKSVSKSCRDAQYKSVTIVDIAPSVGVAIAQFSR